MTLRRAHAVQPVAALQNEYSLWTRGPETNGILQGLRRAGHRLCTLQPSRQGIPHRRDEQRNEDRRRRFPQHRASVFAGGDGEEPDAYQPPETRWRQKERDAGADCPCVAPRPAPHHRPDPWHDEAPSARGKYRRRGHSSDAGRPRRDRTGLPRTSRLWASAMRRRNWPWSDARRRWLGTSRLISPPGLDSRGASEARQTDQAGAHGATHCPS